MNKNNENEENKKVATELYGLARLRELAGKYAQHKEVAGSKFVLNADMQSSSVGRLEMHYWGEILQDLVMLLLKICDMFGHLDCQLLAQ